MADFWQLLFDPQPDQIAAALLAWLGVAVVGGVVEAGTVYFLHRGGMALLPPQRRRAVPWSGWAVVGAFFVLYFAPAIFMSILPESHLFAWMYGPGIAREFHQADDSKTHTLAVARVSLWGMVLGFPVVLGILFGPFSLVVGAKLYQFGWTLHQWPRRALLGALAWLLATPLLYAFFVVVTVAYRNMLNGPEQPHELEILAKNGPSSLEWALLFFSAVIAAPIQEELVFRGILMPWANLSFPNADKVVLWTLPLTLLLRAGRLREALLAAPFSWTELGLELQPLLFALFMVLLYFGLRTVWRSPAPAGIYASALLFGVAHALIWPTPLPLFFLGLNLAALAYRTQGLVAPIALHALFNAVACVTLFLGWSGERQSRSQS